MRRVPGELATAIEERLAEPRVTAAVADVPLPGGDDLQRRFALLVELHRVGHRLGVAAQLTGLAQQLRRPAASSLGGESSQFAVGGEPGRRGDRIGRRGQEPAVWADHRSGLQLQVAPPGHVGGVAERAHHRDAGALGRVGQVVGEDGDADPEQGGAHPAAEQVAVPLVLRMRHESDAGREQLRPGRRDH